MWNSRKLIIIMSLLFLNSLLLYGKPSHRNTSPEFFILITSYNNARYVEENLNSACFQETSRPYYIIYVNDCSTDETGLLVEEYVRRHQLEQRVIIVHNEKNIGGLANHYNIIHSMIPDGKVVVNLDGDDLLMHNKVLKVLESHYEDPDVWMTYGLHREFPMGTLDIRQAYPPHIIQENKIRYHEWSVSHLRTYRAALFKKIDLEDFIYQGAFLNFVPDVAFMIPMLEMCCPYKIGAKVHFRFIPEPLYYWRSNNPNSVCNSQQERVKPQYDIIMAKKRYAPLESLESSSRKLE